MAEPALVFTSEIPEQMKPWHHVILAHQLDGPAGIRRALRARTKRELAEMVNGISLNARILPHSLASLGLPTSPTSEDFWTGQVLPEIRTAMDHRSRPKPPPGTGPIARLKAMDIADVAARFTVLTGNGNRRKGRCPMHQEITASFYVYLESQRWRCYGACASGGDLVDLLTRLDSIGRLG